MAVVKTNMRKMRKDKYRQDAAGTNIRFEDQSGKLGQKKKVHQAKYRTNTNTGRMPLGQI